MAQRGTNKPTQAERAIRVLDYLRHNTDEEHPVLLSKMREELLISGGLGTAETLNDMICGMARALNSDENEASLPEEQWRLLFDGYGTLLEGGDEEKEPGARVRICNLRYRHAFTQGEVDHLIESVLFSKTLSDREADRLVRKIRENLTSKHYTWRYDGIGRVRTPQTTDEEQVWKNIPILQKAIEGKRKVCFCFNCYDRFGKLTPVKTPHPSSPYYTASPYYIAANDGRYYLIGTPDGEEGKPPTKLFLWRVDLMTELKEADGRGVPIDKVKDMRELRNGWDNSFFTRHLNMSYELPETVRLRIQTDEKWPSYTFLYDWFGDSFRWVGEDQVEVVCSRFGMIHWALQYSDRVEVLEPAELREEIRKEVRKLEEKYLKVEEEH